MSEQTAYRVLGWDVGGTKSAAVLGDSGGRILGRREWPSDVARKGWRGMMDDFLAAAGELVAQHGQAELAGVSIGGPMNARKGVILSPPHLPGWDEVPLVELLGRELGLDVVVEHDAAACLLAEWLWGAAQGTTHAVYLTCGTGCGAGVMIDGRVLYGPAGQSPEVGHVRVAPDGPEMFGKRGCVESFCGGRGISKLANFLFPGEFGEPVPTRRLAELAAGGDQAARAVLEESARRTGQVCGMLADLLSPEVIVLGSMARYFEPWWLEGVRAAFAEEALELNGGKTRIVPAGLGERLQDLSAIAPCVYRRLADG